MGKIEKARKMWEKSLMLDADNERVREKHDSVMSEMERISPQP
jgi:hypothetical protein